MGNPVSLAGMEPMPMLREVCGSAARGTLSISGWGYGLSCGHEQHFGSASVVTVSGRYSYNLRWAESMSISGHIPGILEGYSLLTEYGSCLALPSKGSPDSSIHGVLG